MDGWDLYYECVDRELGRQMERHLHLFRESLEWWLYAELNWPSRDWETQLQYLVDHTRYYGLEIHPVSIQSLHNLVEARVNGTGPFEALGPYRWDEPAVATGEPIQLALTVGLDDGTRTDAEPAMNTEIKAGETEFDRKLTEAEGHLEEIAQRLEALGDKLDAAKLNESVVVETEVDAIEELIWRYNDALESAQGTWLREDLSHDALARLHQMQSPRGLGLPWCTDESQAQRIMKQGMGISRRLSGRDASMDRLVFGMEAAETAGNVAGIFLGSGVIIKAGIKGGAWAVVKTLAVAGAAIAAEQGLEGALRAAGAGEQTVRGAQIGGDRRQLSHLPPQERIEGRRSIVRCGTGAGAPRPRQRPAAQSRHTPADLEIRSTIKVAIWRMPRAARTQPHGNAPTPSGAATSTRLLRGDDPSRLTFQGIEVRAVRDLSHLDDATLKAMQQQGFAARDMNGKRLDLHHLNQNPTGPLVEIPALAGGIKNPIQHPLGKQAGVGLNAEQRAAFNKFRKEYWKASNGRASKARFAMNPKTWEFLDEHLPQVERIPGRALTKASDVPSDDEIARAALELDAKFADDYVAFLRRYGGATVGSLPVFGLRPVEATGDPWSVVKVTHQFQKQGWPRTDGWYIISDDGFGNPIGIAADGRVMILYHDVGQISVLADSFEDFLMRHCLAGS